MQKYNKSLSELGYDHTLNTMSELRIHMNNMINIHNNTYKPRSILSTQMDKLKSQTDICIYEFLEVSRSVF